VILGFRGPADQALPAMPREEVNAIGGNEMA